MSTTAASAGTRADFKIYHEEFFGGMTEVLQQQAGLFNGASAGAIRLVPRRLRGDFEKESFMKLVSGIVRRRDPTSNNPVTDKKLEQGELIGVKINRGIGPVANTLDSFRKIDEDPSTFSFILGQQWGQAVAVDYINTALASVDAAIAGVPALNFDATTESTPTITHTHLVEGMSKLGDQSNRLRAWCMHSRSYFDLMKQSIADKIFEVAGVTIYQGSIATFGKPVIVTDSPSLVSEAAGSGGVKQYRVLGLVEDAVEVAESEDREIVSQLITGQDNLVMRIQGEYAYNLKVKGFAWDTSDGGVNPTDAALASSANWLNQMHDPKMLAGVRISTQ